EQNPRRRVRPTLTQHQVGGQVPDRPPLAERGRVGTRLLHRRHDRLPLVTHETHAARLPASRPADLRCARTLRAAAAYTVCVSSRTPGFSTSAGSSAFFAAPRAAANGSGRCRSYQGRWSQPTAWWWVTV